MVLVSFAFGAGEPRIVALAQVALLGIGVVWDVLSSGHRFSNIDGRHLPREARTVGYLGYAVIGLAMSVFVAAGADAELNHQLSVSALQTAGLQLLGVPAALLYVLHVVWRPVGPAPGTSLVRR
jgi:hypothetical protein